MINLPVFPRNIRIKFFCNVDTDEYTYTDEFVEIIILNEEIISIIIFEYKTNNLFGLCIVFYANFSLNGILMGKKKKKRRRNSRKMNNSSKYEFE